MLIALVGTTIAPWMQFYQQASVAEKNVRVEDYALSRLDTIVGCIAVHGRRGLHRRRLLDEPARPRGADRLRRRRRARARADRRALRLAGSSPSGC